MEPDFNFYRNIVIVVLALLFVGYVVNITDKERYDYVLENLKEQGYTGKIIEKYVDKENHNEPTLVLSNGHTVTYYWKVWNKISVNDSIVKKPGDTKILVYKTKDTLVIDLEEEIKAAKIK